MAGSDAKDAMYGGYEPQAPLTLTLPLTPTLTLANRYP